VAVLGRTGLCVSPMGLGLAALGRPGYVNLGHGEDLGGRRSVAAMRRRCHQVLDAAWEAGVRYLDAARSYGRAEEFLASWIEARRVGHPDFSPIVGSKWGYAYTARWRVTAEVHEVKDHSLGAFRRQWAETRARLGDHLALYQIHSVTPDSGVLTDREVLGELGRLRDSGVAVGLSLSGPDQGRVLRQAMVVEVGDRPLFGSVQATWNLIEASAGAALREAHDLGMGVIVKEALANGRLAGRAGGSASGLSALESAAAEIGMTLDALALAAAAAQPWADVVLSGAVTVDQVKSNLSATSARPEPAVVEDLEAALGEAPEQYWATRRSLVWN
jgi:aryl-alcohol dehydrogenase-like predicted oxidoreductase